MPLKAYCFKYGPFRESKEERKKRRKEKGRRGRRFLATNDSSALNDFALKTRNLVSIRDKEWSKNWWNDENFHTVEEEVTLGIKQTRALDLR